eukprot:Opistho-2@60347
MATDLQRNTPYRLFSGDSSASHTNNSNNGDADEEVGGGRTAAPGTGRYVIYHVKLTDAFSMALGAAQKKGKDAALLVEFATHGAAGTFTIEQEGMLPTAYNFGLSSGAGEVESGAAGQASVDCIRQARGQRDLHVTGRVGDKMTVKAVFTKEFAAKTKAKFNETEKKGPVVKMYETAKRTTLTPAQSSVPPPRPPSSTSPNSHSPQLSPQQYKSDTVKRQALTKKVNRLAKGGSSSTVSSGAADFADRKAAELAVIVPALQERTVRLLAVRPHTRTELHKQLKLKGMEVTQLDTVLNKIAKVNGSYFALLPMAYESLSLHSFAEAERAAVRALAIKTFDTGGISHNAPLRQRFLKDTSGPVDGDDGGGVREKKAPLPKGAPRKSPDSKKAPATQKVPMAQSPKIQKKRDRARISSSGESTSDDSDGSSPSDGGIDRHKKKRRRIDGEKVERKISGEIGKSAAKNTAHTQSDSDGTEREKRKDEVRAQRKDKGEGGEDVVKVASYADYERARGLFQSGFPRLQELHAWLERNTSEFGRMGDDIKRLEKGSAEYAALRQKMTDLFTQRSPILSKKQREYDALNTRLRMIKDRVLEFEKANNLSGD